MAIRVTLECGHTSELRAQRTPEGYTHDWQVFVRGVDNAEIHQYIEKVVFHLHETFPKPKRVLKEPPYIVKESGYAGFEIPIDVYLRNKDEPKRFHFSYDLHLQPSGPALNKVTSHNEIFYNPNEDFKKRLLKGGAIVVSNTEGTPEKSKAAPPMVGKPKLSGSEGKKHRMSEPRASNAFADLFGPPIKTAGTKVSPDTKKSSSSSSDKSSTTKLSNSEKVEKTDKSSKAKHSPHKDGKKEKSSEDRKEKKDRDSSKEKEKSKDKSKRSQSPTNKNSHTSPGTKKPSSPLPIKKPPTPPPSQPPKRAPSPKSKEKESKKVTQEKDKEKEKEKAKDSSKSTSEESRSEKKKDKKKHKEDKEKEKKDKHKERDKSKESKESKSVEKKVEKVEKPEKVEKEKAQEFKPPKEGRKSPKPSKEIEKVKEEKPPKLEKAEKIEKLEKTKESKDKEKHKNKHKKRDKKDKREGSKEREKKEKREKNKSSIEKQNSVPPPLLPPPPPPPPVTANPLSTLLAEMPDRDSSDSTPSLDDEPFVEPKAVPIVKKESAPVLLPTVSNESKPNMSPPPPSDKKSRSGRTKREKSKGNREEKETKKRKRRSESKGDEERSVKKERDRSSSPLVEPVSSSQSPIAVDMETVHHAKVKEEGALKKQSTGKGSEGEGEQVAPDSTNSTLAEPEGGDIPSFSEEYVSQLKDLQHKIMTLQDNQELQRVVQVIAETGQYEITKKTFDFDLCTLDRRTVQRLQQFFAS